MKKTNISSSTRDSFNPKKIRGVKWVGIGVIIILAIIVGYWLYLSSWFSPVNYAADVAKPLEKTLVEAGGTRLCSNGDGGHGWDNNSPWYGSSYALAINKADAITLVNDVAALNGYSLTHASPGHRGHLDAVADAYIENWYFDNTKKHAYGGLKDGVIELSFVVYGEGEEEPCNQKIIGQGQSVVGIGVSLPNYK